MDRIAIGDTSFPQWSTITSMKPLDEPDLEQLEQQFDVKLVRIRKSPQPQ